MTGTFGMNDLRQRLKTIQTLLETQKNEEAVTQLFFTAVDAGFHKYEPKSLWEPEKRSAVLQAVLATEAIAGDIVELGIYRGGGTFQIARLLEMLGSSRKVVGVDSFEGLPEPVEADFVQSRNLTHYTKGKFADTSKAYLEQIFKLYGLSEQTRLVEGFFEDVVPSAFAGSESFSLVIIDCDQYSGTRFSLEYFYHRVPQGGMILVDDYNGTFAPGVTRAVNEFLQSRPEKMIQGGKTMWGFTRLG